MRSTAQFAVDECKGVGVKPLGVEGTAHSRWVLVDYGDVVLHIFLEELRSYYDMDALWADAPRVDTGIDTARLKEVEPS